MKTLLLLALTLLQCLAAASVQAAWNPDWTRRARVTVNTATDGVPITTGADQVPVLVRLHTGNFEFLEARADGADLRFIAADDKTPLKFHIEKFDGINELAFVWVLLPRVNPGSKADSFWLYYGNPNAAPASDAKASYDAAQALVYHFAVGQALPQDATANGRHATRLSATVSPAGLIDAGLRFDGRSELALDAPAAPPAGGDALTVSMWLRPGAPSEAVLWRQGEGAAALSLLLRGGTLVAQSGRVATPAAGALVPERWQHVALVLKDGLAVYLDGAEIARTSASLRTPGGAVVAGSGYVGEIDELQVATAARSADWLRLAALGQGPEQRLLVTTPEAAEASHGASYVSVLLGAVTVDGWVVIGVLALMFVISAWVMLAKALLVRQTARENDRFMAHFAQLVRGIEPGEPTAQRAGKEAQLAARFGRSPLYRLYAAAVHELHSRLDARRDSGQAMVVNASALSAIKATVDARLVRELQGLNSRLVVLTVSIAGGPFLGLLGTVVGVMITFAAIAAAGDVNVNSIAPGIAAALVATVAGLSVAIPCLFGYNFLTTRIGEITADLQAFVDELVTRIAEDHSA